MPCNRTGHISFPMNILPPNSRPKFLAKQVPVKYMFACTELMRLKVIFHSLDSQFLENCSCSFLAQALRASFGKLPVQLPSLSLLPRYEAGFILKPYPVLPSTAISFIYSLQVLCFICFWSRGSCLITSVRSFCKHNLQ
jgi:hypothetical protein